MAPNALRRSLARAVPRSVRRRLKRSRPVQRFVRGRCLPRLLAFPSRIEIETTSFCNGRCRHCEYSTLGRPPAHMSMDLYRKIVDECAIHSDHCREVYLFWMGEPFLDPTFFEKVRYAKEKDSFLVASYSNGSMLTPENCDRVIESGLDSLVFGTDGATKESYESIRVNLSYGRMVEGITRLAELKKRKGVDKPHIKVQMVLTPHNEHEVELFEQTWAGIADEVTLRKMAVWSSDAMDESLEDYSRQLIGEEIPASVPCVFLWVLMVVAQDGRVAFCCTDARVQEVVGDLNSETLEDVWRGDRMARLRELHVAGRLEDVPLCATCNHRQIVPYPWWWYD